MCTRTKLALAALLATSLVQAAEVRLSPAAAAAAPLATLPIGWNLMGNGGPQALPGACELGIDGQKASDGRTLYTVRCTSTVLPSFGGARKAISEVARYRGKRVRVSSLMMVAGVERVDNAKYPDASGEAGLWIGVGTPRDGLISNRMQGRTLSGTTGWEQRDFVVDIPQDANQLSVGFWMQGKGQLWVQELAVEEVATTVPVNFDRSAPRPDAAPDMTLATATVPRPGERYLPPPPKWLALGEPGFELCDAGIDAAMLVAGQRNLTISCSVPMRAYLRQAFEAQTFWGKRVRFSGWIRTENVEPRSAGAAQPGAGLYLAATDTSGPVYYAVATGTTGWTYQELVIDIPAGAPYIPSGVSMMGTGQVWVRDLKFEVVSSDVPVTRLPFR